MPDRLHYSAIITSMFVHGGWMHIAGNMRFLWIFGNSVEDLLGHAKFFCFTLLCGIAGGMVQSFWSIPTPRMPTIGASGAIAGVMGAYLIKFPRAHIVTLVFIFVFITTVDIPRCVSADCIGSDSVLQRLRLDRASQVSEGDVAWFAHVGGFLAGMLLVMLMPTQPRVRRWYRNV